VQVLGEQLLDGAGVALGPVGDEDLVGRDVRAAGAEVSLRDRLAEEIVAEVISSTPSRKAFTTAGVSGRVTSPMPSRITDRPGCAAWNAATRFAISLKRYEETSLR
jgi:hypothetical protein